ncbi:hypothetical protein [Brevibacillus daliensis]|uniref:hypothetical protein n=1 Tax=Brevibacillus daliensis TaxID=2892995 RepID=UPI001E462006|nr:hypothetical protein [Brevibacillus daliensis]
MAVRKEDLHNLIDKLGETDKKTVFDFMKYLIDRSQKKPSSWSAIDAAEPDDIPLSQEENDQLNNNDEYISWEKAKHELGI